MDQKSQNTVPVKRSRLTKTDAERESRKSMCFNLLKQSRAVLVLECQRSAGPPAPCWIQSYSSPHMAGIGLRKIPNNLPVWQVALASIKSPSHSHHVEIDGVQDQDVNSVGCIDLYAAIYAEVCEGDDYVRSPVAVSIGPDESKCSYAYFGNHLWEDASSIHAAIPQDLHEELHRHYRFDISHPVHGRSSRTIGKTKAFKQSLQRKLPRTIKYIPAALRGSNSREQVEISNDESSRIASSTDVSTKDELRESAKGHETLSYITTFTEAYLLRDDVQTRIFECAQTLVERRRHRVQIDPIRWKRQCYGLRYQCVHGNCVGNNVEYGDRDTLTYHVLHRHRRLSLFADNLASILNDCMSVVL